MLKKPEKKDNFKKKGIKPIDNSLEGLRAQVETLSKNLANPKDKEKYLEMKERHYRKFLEKINLSNNNKIQFPT
jgi:hypothetical protein